MNVGDYVRTKKQGIKRIDKIFENATVNKYGYEDKNNDYEYFVIRTDEIIKSSPQIIDLIQCGDYVNYNHFNGGIVLAKTDDEITTNTILLHNLKNEDIKNVTTHEQMEAMQYRVEE